MTDRYYNKDTQTELLTDPGLPAHLLYDVGNPDHVALIDTNPYFLPLPAGQQLTYDIDGIPDGLEPIPAPIYTVEEQAAIDLTDTGVTNNTLLAARYADDRGDPAPLAAIDASVDAVVISSGLTLTEVIGLI